jgi:acyl dehydratase
MSAAQAYDIGKPYTVIAHQARHKSFNRMHKDGLPQKLGFRGAFVLGVANYGNMTRALASRLGEAWLGRAVIEVKFIKPVCEGDTLRIETLPVAGREQEQAYEVTAYNETMNSEIAARMQTSAPTSFPDVDPTASLAPNEWEGPVTQRRTWDNIVLGKAYRSLRLTLSAEDNAYWQGVLEDDLPIYARDTRPPIHPSQVLRLVQLGYNNQFIGDNAVHSSTKAVVRRMLHVGDPVHLLTVPLAKWDKKQNHWLTIYCAVRSNDEVCAEIYHTQIIKLRGSEDANAAKVNA